MTMSIFKEKYISVKKGFCHRSMREAIQMTFILQNKYLQNTFFPYQFNLNSLILKPVCKPFSKIKKPLHIQKFYLVKSKPMAVVRS